MLMSRTAPPPQFLAHDNEHIYDSDRVDAYGIPQRFFGSEFYHDLESRYAIVDRRDANSQDKTASHLDRGEPVMVRSLANRVRVLG